jgi:LysM repeat protein
VPAAFNANQALRQLKKYRATYWHADCDTPSCFDVDILGNSGILIPDKPTPVSTPAPAASTSVTPTVAAPITSTVSSPAAPAPSGTPGTYVVSKGDTLTLIAKRFNTTIEALMQANHLTDADFVWTGQTLIIP